MSLPSAMDGRAFLRALCRIGWSVVRQRGSHRRLEHALSGRRIKVAFHAEIGRPAIRRTLEDGGIEEGEFLAAVR